MTRRSVSVLHALVWIASMVASAQAPASASSTAFRLPDYKRVQLPNGLTLLLMEKRQIPVLSVQALVKSGSTADPQGKEGTAAITAELLRRGTESKPAAQFANEVDFIGMNLQTDASLEYSTATARFLAKDTDRGLGLVADMLMHPAFPEAEVKRQVEQSADEVRSAKDDPSDVLDRYYAAFLFKGHPYGRPVSGDEKSIPQIGRADLVGFHQTNYTPANTVLAVVGDFQSATMEQKLRGLFGGWKGTAPAAVNVPAVKPFAGRRVLLVDKPDATQTYIAIGNIGMARTDANRAPADVVNTLFGGRFTSMINAELRIKSGLTYGARSGFERHRAPGAFDISTFTKNASTAETLEKTLEVLGRLHNQPFTPEQLSSAKAYIRGEMPPRVETTSQLATAIAELEFYGLPRSDFDTYLTKVDATSGSDAAKMIQTYYPKAENLTMVIIGKASEIEPVLKKYGANIERKKIGDAGF